jgi:putative flippase GtrA
MDRSELRALPSWQPLLRFGVASVASTAVTLAGLGLLLQLTAMPSVAANVIATSAGTVLAYEMNRRWVWGTGRRQRMRDFLAFWGLSVAGLALSTLAVGGADHLLQAAHSAAAIRTPALQLTNLAAFATLTLLKLALSRSMFAAR